jgi:hypothetical protein
MLNPVVEALCDVTEGQAQIRNDAVAWLRTGEVDFPMSARWQDFKSGYLRCSNQGKASSKGRPLVHGRPILMVRHFLRSTERHKLVSKNFDRENCQN